MSRRHTLSSLTPLLLLFVLVTFLSVITVAGSSGCTGPGAKAAHAGEHSLLDCGKKDLLAHVQDGSGLTILGTVAQGLWSKDYQGAVDALSGTLGADAVGCAVLAVQAVASSTADQASPTQPKTQQPSPLALRAAEVAARHGWKTSQAPGAESAP
jgi:hypothetical protein